MAGSDVDYNIVPVLYENSSAIPITVVTSWTLDSKILLFVFGSLSLS